MENLSAANLGWADVRHVVEFKEEVKSGSLLTVRTRVIKIGRTSLTFHHEMLSLSGTLHATMEVVSVMFDLKVRCATTLPDNLRSAAEDLLVQEAA